MNLRKSVLATLPLVALALAGCGTDGTKNNADGKGVGAVSARLTLPDDTTITDVHYLISRTGFMRDGHVPVGDSTMLLFRVGGIPIADDYTLELDAETSDGSECAGSAEFNVTNNLTTLVSLTLNCGAAVDDQGDVIIDGEVEQACPVVKAISAIPAEVTLGHSVTLTVVLTGTPASTDPVHWSGAGGTFGSADANVTTFQCTDAGSHTLTVAVNTDDCTDAKTVDVICTVGELCGNNMPDDGEECDDGNAENTDACTNSCHDAACGDGYVQGTEECDDGSTTNGGAGDLCSATCLEIDCGNGRTDPGEACDDGDDDDTDACRNNCTLPGCGDGVESAGEECDDGNASNTDTCTNTCEDAACGDGFIQSGEQCDDTNTTSGDGCSATCQTEVVLSACEVCREANCHEYYDGTMDAVSGCFDEGAEGAAARADWASAGNVFTPAQVQACVNAISCAETSNCGHDPGRPGASCYCGSNFPDNGDCAGAPETSATLPVPNGVCKTAFQTAAGTSVPSMVLPALGSLNTPAGWATYLLECESTFCATDCSDAP